MLEAGGWRLEAGGWRRRLFAGDAVNRNLESSIEPSSLLKSEYLLPIFLELKTVAGDDFQVRGIALDEFRLLLLAAEFLLLVIAQQLLFAQALPHVVQAFVIGPEADDPE